MDKPPQILLLNFEQIVALSQMQETIDALLRENEILKQELESKRAE